MDKQYEEIVVRNFFDKAFRERFIYELSSRKKRRIALLRLGHNYKDVFVNSYMQEIPKPNSDPLKILNLLRKNGAGDLCYVMSVNERIDGLNLSLENALQQTVGYGLPSIILCIPHIVGYFEAEQESGPPPRFLLRRSSDNKHA